MVKLTKREVQDLLNLIDHVRMDMYYGSGGTFYDQRVGKEEEVDKKAMASAVRAIERIKVLIVNGV